MEPHNRPRVFVSSTIRDFADLRSALKFWLEEMGFEARLSEYNDFEPAPDAGTYESCFNSIRECDYYVLLVGERRGSWYDEAAQASVTQQEFRVAADRADAGLIKTVILVRNEVLDAVGERQELIAADPANAGLAAAATRRLPEPEWLIGFLDEIKNREVQRLGEGPAGKIWRYGFSDFRDIVDVLRVNLKADRSVRRQALLANVRWELVEDLSVCSYKIDNYYIAPAYLYLSTIRDAIHIDPAADIQVTVTSEQWLRIFLFTHNARRAWRIRTMAMREALTSGEFLLFDQETRSLNPDEIRLALTQLVESADRAIRLIDELQQIETRVLPEFLEQNRRGGPTRDVPVDYLATVYMLHDALKDFWQLGYALLRHIERSNVQFEMPELSPTTPYAGQVEAVQRQVPTHAEIDAWLDRMLAMDDQIQELMEQLQQIVDAQGQ